MAAATPPYFGVEGGNPARRYKWFRPRQAARSGLVVSQATNRATHSLYNNSTGPQILVVRTFDIADAQNESWASNIQPGAVGTNQGAVQPMMPDMAAPPGQHYYSDTATVITQSYIHSFMNAHVNWPHEFPIAILPPGWSFVLQATANAHQAFCGFLWEAIAIEELDYIF